MQYFLGMISRIKELISDYITMPKVSINFIDVIEILIIAVLFYYVIVWVKSTRAWVLFKGIAVILGFVLVAALFQMNTILWLAQNTFNIGLIALVIIFQPELRKALENLGGRNIAGRIFAFSKNTEEKFSEKTIDELVKACVAMGKVKTGALIVIEDEVDLSEFVKTGIDVDGLITSQLLLNIFEKNTPLHDGAVIVKGNRVVAATCYLPLSDSTSISKALGTRHRAALGVSEVSDSLTIIVSEETGNLSVAMKGQMYHNITPEFLREQISYLQNRNVESAGFELIRRRIKNAKKNSENSD